MYSSQFGRTAESGSLSERRPSPAPAGRALRRAARLLLVLAIPLAALAMGCSAGGPRPGASPSGGSGQAKAAIPWITDYEAGLAQAKEADKPVMVEVSTTWCAACKRLDEEVFSRPDVAAAVEQFTPVRVDGEERPDLEKEFEVSGYPTIVFLDRDGDEVGRVRGAVPHQVMLTEVEKAARKADAVP